MNSKFQYYFVLLIPIINAIAANTTGFFPEIALNPGAIRGLIIGIFTIYFLFTKLTSTKTNLFLLFYLFFFLLITVLSSKILFSLDLYLKFFLGVAMFPLGYYYINSIDKFKTLIYFFVAALIIYIIAIATANIFKLGSSDYLADSFYFGMGRVNITKSMLLLVFFAPITLFFSKKKKLISIIFLAGLLIALIGIKRSVLLSALSAVLIYIYLKKEKTALLKGIMGVAILFILFIVIFPNYIDTFLLRFEAREERIEVTEESLDKEARYNETFLVLDAWENGSVKHKLIGSELFNDRYFFNTHRMLHTDYMIILNGAGIIGIFLWFYIYWVIIKEKNKYYKYLKNEELFREMNSLFYMFLAAQMLMSISSTVYAIDIRSIFFLYWGAMIGTMRTRFFELKERFNTNQQPGFLKNELVYNK